MNIITERERQRGMGGETAGGGSARPKFMSVGPWRNIAAAPLEAIYKLRIPNRLPAGNLATRPGHLSLAKKRRRGRH